MHNPERIEVKSVEYFTMREVIYWVSFAIVVGIFVGSAFAHYKDFRFNKIKNGLIDVEKRFKEFETARQEISSELPQDLLTVILNLVEQQFFYACHGKSNKGAVFPSEVKFEKIPNILISQSQITIGLTSAFKTGTFTAPTNPIVVNKVGNIYPTYDVSVPASSASELCVLFFDSFDEKKK